MARKPLLSKCDTCKEPKPGYAYRRDADKVRHGSCIVCEDALAALKAQRRSDAARHKIEYNRARYAAVRKRPARATLQAPRGNAIRTHWLGGAYPGDAR